MSNVGRMKAGHWVGTALAFVVITATATATTGEAIAIPLITQLVRVERVLMLLVPTIGLFPLYSVLDALERTLPRTTLFRSVQVVLASTAVVASSAWAGHLWTGPIDGARLTLVTFIPGVVAVVLIGRLAWSVALTTGLLLMLLDLQMSRPVTTTLEHVPLAVVLGLLALASACYVRFGAAETRGAPR